MPGDYNPNGPEAFKPPIDHVRNVNCINGWQYFHYLLFSTELPLTGSIASGVILFHRKVWTDDWVSRSPCKNHIISIHPDHLLSLRSPKAVDQASQLNLSTLGHCDTTAVAALTVNNLEAPDLKKKWGLAPAISHANPSHVNGRNQGEPGETRGIKVSSE